MAIQTEPTRIQIPFADSGTKNVIPDTNSTPSASQAASWTDGFPSQCSLPLSAGGIPPARADFNGILNTMTQSERFTQEGGVWEWNATVDYGANRMVLGTDGSLYWSVAQSGPNVGGAQDPTADDGTYWMAIPTKTMPANDKSAAAATTEWVDLWHTKQTPAPDYYIDPTNGDDANDGLSAVSPMQTLAHCFDVITNSKFVSPSIVNIHLAAGTYSELLYNSITGVDIAFKGPDSGLASFSRGYFANRNTSSLLYGRIQLRGYVNISRGSIVQIQDGCYLEFNDLGSASQAFSISVNGVLTTASGTSCTVAFTGTSSFSQATVHTLTGGRVAFVGVPTFTGTVTGKRYKCEYGSGVNGAGSATLFPGNANGTVDSTSYYY